MTVLCAGTVVAVRAPDFEVFIEPITTRIDSGKSQEQQLEDKRLEEKIAADVARKTARRAQIAKKRAEQGITETGVYYSDGGNKDTVGKVVVQSSGDVVVGEQDPATLSEEQREAISATEKTRSFFDVPEGKEHPLSSLELIKEELEKNERIQEAITNELQKEDLDLNRKQELEEALFRLQQQKEVLINGQEFLAFCKDSSSPVTFTGPELEKIFTVLDLPSLSDLKDKTPYDLGGLKADLNSKIKLVASVKEDGSVNREVGNGVPDGVIKEGYIIYGHGPKAIVMKRTQFFDAPLIGDKKEALSKYLKDKLGEVSKAQQQKDVFINSQEFLAFCKAKPSPVTFTDNELKEIFTVLDLPSLSSLESMNLKNLEELESDLKRKWDSIQRDEVLSKDKKDALSTYLKNRLDKVSKLAEEELNDHKAFKKDQEGMNLEKKKNYFDERKDTINIMVEELLNSIVNRKGIDTQIADINLMIGSFKVKVNFLKFDDEKYPGMEKSFNQLETTVDNARIVIHFADLTLKVNQIEANDVIHMQELQDELKSLSEAVSKIYDGKSKKELLSSIKELSDSLNGSINTLLTPEQRQKVTKFFDLKAQATQAIEDGNVIRMQELQDDLRDFYEVVSKIYDGKSKKELLSSIKELSDSLNGSINTLLTPEQRQKVTKFFDLKAQATQAIEDGNVIRMQELQDDLRDFYEATLRAFDGTSFLQDVRYSINELLGEIKEKAQSFTSVTTNKKSFVERVKYRFKRLFVRATLDPRKLRYRSEFAVNKAGFGLNLVDFKKAATDGYVETVESGIKTFTDSLAKVKSLQKLKADGNGSQGLDEALTTLRSAMGNVQTVAQEVFALQGVASLKGTLSLKTVEKYLKTFDLAPNEDEFLRRLRWASGAKPYKELAVGLLKTVDSKDVGLAIENIEKNTELNNKEQEEVLKNLYKTWFKSIARDGKGMKDMSLENLSNLRLLATFNGASAEYVNVLRTPQTGQYVLDAYKTRSNVKVPSDQAKAIVSKLSDFSKVVVQLEEAERLLAKETVASDSPAEETVANDNLLGSEA